MNILNIGLIFGAVLLALIWSIIHFRSITKIKIGKPNKTLKVMKFPLFMRKN